MLALSQYITVLEWASHEQWFMLVDNPKLAERELKGMVGKARHPLSDIS